MLVHRYRLIRFARIASCAALALLALPMADALAQQVVTLSNARGLDFGRFVAGSGGAVALSATGVRSRTGGVVLLNSPSAGQAVFNVGKSANGGNNRVARVTLPPNGTIRLASGANSMAVDAFVCSPATATITIPNSGTTLSVGATLTVAPNQAPGTYSGSFPLTVNYE